ncbi:molybdate ABC transporter substrate-binding protein [Brevirhabdus pacifica]|uniref:Molybdate ABC transporter substrate-binding protein n=1 Tax=Brevirhabdus pacifica TaxID=1267768 RepID=A0A1U7DF88_9RHOB|nr:molybdate ABC transporter substrate-binding protein [Brevirhabdus pacifica]APX88626.1 molybdate ABC transporter substrate-binding protein [Brevirhabdus pacifica]OWU79903.1 hypothetical protein ATO5_02550 [Loktanella sp. 22II-4b]PJJ86878.1 molybdate transport system substrate-binding protein [Brevirhabdus pacifica]
MRALLAITLMLGLSGLAPLPAGAGQVSVAAASNVVEPLEALAPIFAARTGHRVSIINGSTGKLYAQILRGAPFDVFLAADQERPALLEKAGLTVGPARTYALGRLALWSSRPTKAAKEAEGTGTTPPDDAAVGQMLKARLSGDFGRLAIADPVLAPYGLAAMQALKALGMDEALSDRLVLGENIGQTFAFVATGNAGLGLVALSQLRSPRQDLNDQWLVVPDSLHDPIRQDAVLLAGERDPAAAEFFEFLFSDEARAVLSDFGYGTDGE